MFTVRRCTYRPRYTVGNAWLGIDKWKDAIYWAVASRAAGLPRLARVSRIA